jgi:hypothetical protein
MILRKEPDGTMIMINQTDHSRLVGQMAAHWGNENFEAVKPFGSIVRAASYHDYGWLRYETWPAFDDKTGTTPDFRSVPGTPRQLEGYAWVPDWLVNDDPYASLIIKMHRTGLWRERYKSIQHPVQSSRTQGAEIDNFIAKAEAEQERERKAFDVEELWTNFRLFEVWDLLGLYFCCADPCDDYFEPVPVRYGGDRQEGLRMTVTAVTPRKVRFDPFPFDKKGLTIQLNYKRLPKQTFADADEFRAAYFKAETEMMNFELV